MAKTVRVKGYARKTCPVTKDPMNTRSNKQLLLGHSLTHSRGIQKAWGVACASDEHARLVRKMKKRGMKHRSRFKPRGG